MKDQLDTQRDFQRDISRHLLWSWWIFFWAGGGGCWFRFCQETELLPIHLRDPKSGLLTGQGMDPMVFGGLFILRVVSVLQKEGEDAHVRPLEKAQSPEVCI